MEAVEGREGGRGFGAAAGGGLVVLAACLAVIATTPGDAYWVNDCGNKALVAQRMVDTRFEQVAFDRPGAEFDSRGRWFPIPPPFALRRGEAFVSAYPAAYPALAAAGLATLGPRGLRLPAALGAAACAALFALWVAPALGCGVALVGALTLGLATPLFFYGVTVWEHSLTVALSLGAWLLLSGERIWRWAAAGVLIAAACWLREELVLMALALVAAAGLRGRPLRLVVALAVGASVPTAALLFFNAGFYGHPLGGHVAANLGADAGRAIFSGGADVSRLTAVPGLLGGFGHRPAERWVLGLLGLALPLAGALAPRRAREAAGLTLALAGVGLLAWGIACARMLNGATPLRELVLHNGLLLQWPMFVLAGLGARRVLHDAAFAALRTAALAGALFALLVVAAGMALPSGFGVQVGAGVHWGPRVLLPALPAFLLFALAAISGRPPAARLAWGALALAGILSTLLAMWFLTHQKLDGARFAKQLHALEPRVVLTSHPLLAQHLAALWEHKAMLLTADVASLRGAAQALQRGRERAFLFVGPAGAPLASWLPGIECASAFRYRGRPLHYLDLDVQECKSEDPASRPHRARRSSR
jgi:hypothetical protein